ncbi:hypothetical protein AKJ09_11315 [Labilithrix luteola]|uniref:Uncharacterized protein n=1 Tax=Labilithrix luteola TaxID=1391654 RepID=A0A0K1QG55_9BACT|nr:hypothetical protein AKJ09_11315 [Labilithrix luteola]
MIAAAERVERAGGASAGLTVWRRLAASANSADLRGEAIVRGLRCAVKMRDLGALQELTKLWETVDQGVWDGLFEVCKELWRVGMPIVATGLALAEVRRLRTARALYTYARALDSAGDPRAAQAFEEVVPRAEAEGAKDIERAARLRLVAWLARSPETLARAIEEAKKVSPNEVSAADRLVLARVLLRSPSRFVRAGALGLLDDVVSNEDARTWHVAALTLAASHADRALEGLSSLELDRLNALLGRAPIVKLAGRAREALAVSQSASRAPDDASMERVLDAAANVDPAFAPLYRRAQDIASGRFEAQLEIRDDDRLSDPWPALLDVVAAMRDRRAGAGHAFGKRAPDAAAAHRLRQLAELVERGGSVPVQTWTVAQAALGDENADVRAVAGRLFAAMLGERNGRERRIGPPPHGWSPVAQALSACGMESLATTARRCASAAKETGAEDALSLALTRSGWELAQAGDRSRAIARLREARSIALASHPPGAKTEAAAPKTPASAKTPVSSPSS